MFLDSPDVRLSLVNLRNAELIAESASARLATARQKRRNFSGFRLRIGTFLIVVGRTLCEDEVLYGRPAHP